jgi:predicted PurR-regulated permease PerM
MWLHLGGPYWQRASFDAVVIIAALLGLYCVGPAVTRFSRRHWRIAAFLAVVLAGFLVVYIDSMRFAARKLSPFFEQIEAGSPP